MSFCKILPVSAVLIGLVGAIPTVAQTNGIGEVFRVINPKESTTKLNEPPIVRIVSPLEDASIAPGAGRAGVGSPDGAGFALNVEVTTRDRVNVAATEGLNIRDTTRLGKPNLNFPRLFVFFDTDLITPDGGITRKNTNLASLFNVAGTDDTPGPGVTIWTGWHVLESLPPNVNEVTITVAVVDNLGRLGLDRVTLNVQRNGVTSGQALTPAPLLNVGGDGIDDLNGPEVTMIAPRVPTRISPGTASPTPPASGSLFFIQVSALDRSRSGIGVNEGIVLDPTQLAVSGANRNYPGLFLTFDVPLLTPTGAVIPAGNNLAPVFNIAGSELDKDGVVRTTADWVVGGSLVIPPGKKTVTITARVTDNRGRTGSARQVVGVSSIVNGQNLTPNQVPNR